MINSNFPDAAEIVIIGGGIIGCSLAYHLAINGHKDVLLLEQGQLSCGTTWHAAGLVGQLRSHSAITRLIRYSTELYSQLEAETGQATGWAACGSLTVARTPERMVALRRTISSARAQGVSIEELSPTQAREKWPLMRADDLQGAVWLPGDGKANPTDITQALARGARSSGAKIMEGVRVTGFLGDERRVTAVETTQGRIACDMIAITAGQWSRQLGLMCGVTVPLHSAEHMYIVTEPIAGIYPGLPVMRDPDGYVYFKEEVGGLVMGGFEPDAKPWGMRGIPDRFVFELLPDDWEQFEILMKHAIERVPALEQAGVKTFINGPESFTPDNQFLLGRAAERENVFVGAGFNSMGIASAGGAGKALSEWMIEGEATCDLWSVDIRRFAPFNNNAAWLHDRVKETLGLHYAMPWPNRELLSARPGRRSPLYDRLAHKGAVFGTKMGWERANWFAPPHMTDGTVYTFSRQNWFEVVGEEHQATRNNVSLFDMTSFAKLDISGQDSLSVLQYLCANDMDIPVGHSIYTPMLNKRGGFESDVTVARLAPDRFLAITGTGQAVRDVDWIGRHVPSDLSRVHIADVTNAWTILGLMGPKSRVLLSRLTDACLDNFDFPFGAIRPLSIGYAPCLASRRSYVGELGWELYVPTEFAAQVYDDVHQAGQDLGLRDGGYYAIESLRVEKGYRAWGRDLTPDITPFQAGLAFTVKLAKGHNFIGRDALLVARSQPLSSRIVSILAKNRESPPAWGGEVVLANGEVIGEVTSAAYGYSVGGVIGLALVSSRGEPIDEAWFQERDFTINISGELVPVYAGLKPFHDPLGQSMRA